jgi:DNA-binding IclR family transcriptional regulator
VTNTPTPAQARVLRALVALCQERAAELRGLPTVEEVGDRAGRSTTATHAALVRLVRDGYAEHEPNCPRSYRPTKEGLAVVD